MLSPARSALVALAVLSGCVAEPVPEREHPAERSVTVARSQGPTRLLVDSVPSDAVVHVDGVLRGTTPLELREVLAGPHLVTVDGPAGSREERVVIDRGETATVVVTAWRATSPPPTRTPEELGRAVVEALRSRDRAALERLVPGRDEIAASLGEPDPDRARTALLRKLDEDWASLDEFSGVPRARRLRVSGLDVQHGRICRDPFARAVDAVLAPLLVCEVDGRTMTVKLGPFVRSGDGSWRLLSLLPSRYQ